MLVTIFDAEASNATKTVDGYGKHPIQVQAATSATMTGGTLTVSGSLDGVNFIAIAVLGFSATEMNNKLVKYVASGGYTSLKFDLANVTWSTTGTTTVVLHK